MIVRSSGLSCGSRTIPQMFLEVGLLEFIYGYILVKIDIVSVLWIMFPLDSLSSEPTWKFLQILPWFVSQITCHAKIICTHDTMDLSAGRCCLRLDP